jgi:hypothetical protein
MLNRRAHQKGLLETQGWGLWGLIEDGSVGIQSFAYSHRNFAFRGAHPIEGEGSKAKTWERSVLERIKALDLWD